MKSEIYMIEFSYLILFDKFTLIENLFELVIIGLSDAIWTEQVRHTLFLITLNSLNCHIELYCLI